MRIEDPHSPRISLRATGRLAALNRADVLESADIHVAQRLAALAAPDAPGVDDDVLLGVALAVRSVRLGAVCVDLASPPEVPPELPEIRFPAAEAWLATIAASPLTSQGVLRLEGTRLYLDRHWREERGVCDALVARVEREWRTDGLSPEQVRLVEAAVDRLFPSTASWEEQRRATTRAGSRRTTILTGGPGTGKTTTVARLLAVLAELNESRTGRPPRIAMAAPTGKAATRLQESVTHERRDLAAQDASRLAGVEASTLHRLLGWRPDSSTRFRHDAGNPLPHDIVVVDEVSMVSLSQMARLLEALRPSTSLVLVGDPDQLSSVEAGAVLADLVDGFGETDESPVIRLRQTHRTADDAAGRTLDELADAVRHDDADRVLALLGSGVAGVRRVDPTDDAAMAEVRARVVSHAEAVARAATDADSEAALSLVESHRLLCAHREGAAGVSGWNRQVRSALTEAAGLGHLDEWFAGRPVLVTSNDRGLGLSNGDLGVTVLTPDAKLRVMIRVEGELRAYAPTRLAAVDTVYAMTVHKSQGSEARTVTVVLPPTDSPLLTRELFYTAVTRARQELVVVGTDDAVRAAVERRVQRASGLAERLRERLARQPAP